MQKFKAGDRVKVKYGHIMWSKTAIDSNGIKTIKKGDNGNWFMYDINPSLTEDEATVEYEYKEKYGGDNQKNQYSLKFDKHGSVSWFDEDHLIPI